MLSARHNLADPSSNYLEHSENIYVSESSLTFTFNCYSIFAKNTFGQVLGQVMVASENKLFPGMEFS